MNESQLFPGKANESLASAEADLSAGCYNSCANRAYNAALQAAVAALIVAGMRPKGAKWEHKFVISGFSGTIVRRRKLVPAGLRSTLDFLMTTRAVADYGSEAVSKRTERESLRRASRLVQAVGDIRTR